MSTKVVILAGGFGTRLSEETDLKPKPMVEIGGMPILWHIMKIYGAAGFTDFVICAGYKASAIKRYFVDYFLENSDVEVDTATGDVRYLSTVAEPWRVKVIDTGLETMTGGRLKHCNRQHTSLAWRALHIGRKRAELGDRAADHCRVDGKLGCGIFRWRLCGACAYGNRRLWAIHVRSNRPSRWSHV